MRPKHHAVSRPQHFLRPPGSEDSMCPTHPSCHPYRIFPMHILGACPLRGANRKNLAMRWTFLYRVVLSRQLDTDHVLYNGKVKTQHSVSTDFVFNERSSGVVYIVTLILTSMYVARMRLAQRFVVGFLNCRQPPPQSGPVHEQPVPGK